MGTCLSAGRLTQTADTRTLPRHLSTVECPSLIQEHDADLDDRTKQQNDGNTNVYVSKPGAAPVESLLEPLTFFAHLSLSIRYSQRPRAPCPLVMSCGQSFLLSFFFNF
jgi:hypothetical protein